MEKLEKEKRKRKRNRQRGRKERKIQRRYGAYVEQVWLPEQVESCNQLVCTDADKDEQGKATIATL